MNGIIVNAWWNSVRMWLAETPLARRAAEVLFRASVRRHLAQLDQAVPARCQARILLGLVHQAQRTPFGRDHDFRRIRTVADYRRLVPLRSSLFPDAGPSAPALHAVHRAGLRTALALVSHLRPQTRLLAGRLLYLDEEASAERLPALLRPYTLTSPERQRRDTAGPVAGAPGWCAAETVTCIIGSAERFLSLLTRKPVSAVWPGLTAVVCSGRSPADIQRVRREVGPGVLVLEMVWRPEGLLAIEDPRLGSLRLLHDHGLYFELLPVGTPGEPPRLGLDEAAMGVPHELVVTAPGGLWAYRTGRMVCLERRHPPLVRFLDMAAPAAVVEPVRAREEPAVITVPSQQPHRQTAGIPAALPESFVHSPWSALAGRE